MEKFERIVLWIIASLGFVFGIMAFFGLLALKCGL